MTELSYEVRSILLLPKTHSSFPSISCFRLLTVACNNSCSRGFFCSLPPSVGSSSHGKQTAPPISTEMKIICFCKFYVLIKFFTQYIWSCFSNSSQILPTSLSSILSLFQNKTKKQNKKTTKVRNKQTKNTMKTIIQANSQRPRRQKMTKQGNQKKRNHKINFMLTIYFWTWVLP